MKQSTYQRTVILEHKYQQDHNRVFQLSLVNCI